LLICPNLVKKIKLFLAGKAEIVMKVRIIQSSLEYDGFLRVEKDVFQFEQFDGEMSPPVERFRYTRGDAVAVIIFDKKRDSVLLIHQFRNAVHARTGEGWLTECVAGMMKKGETPESVAFREVAEETGLELEKVEHLTSYFISPGGCSDQVHLFLGTLKNPDHPLGVHGLQEEGENVLAEWIPFDQAKQMVWQKQILDAKALIGLLLLAQRRRN
jgi:ADP-ribose pyrophosphatase